MSQKKAIRIKFMDYWDGFEERNLSVNIGTPKEFLFLRLLKKHFDVIICDDADYVFFSAFGESHWRVPDSAIKIFHTEENLAPDFNACDYAIGFEWMEYGDRYIRFPNYLRYPRLTFDQMIHKHELGEGWDLKTEKTAFCSFVVSNPKCEKRIKIFEALSEYKRVDSGGQVLNNIGGPVKNKIEFESSHKFSICCENTSHSGYTTEKLVQAFAARTIPIYWGDPDVNKVFNPKAFINVSDYATIDDLVDEIKRIDNDDQLYMSILKEPALLPSALSIDEEYDRLEKWLIPIFERPICESYRRNREMHGLWYIWRRHYLSILDDRNPKKNRELLHLFINKFITILRFPKRS